MDGTIIIDHSMAGKRLDQVVSDQLGTLSRARVQRAIKDGHITLNGLIARPSVKVKTNDRIDYHIPATIPPRVEPQEIPLDIIHEDDQILIINKPAGMVVHPGAGNPDHTVANALLHHLGAQGVAGNTIRPGVVHRLDKDTSGVLVLAKTEQAHLALSRAFAERRVSKVYISLCRGTGLKQEFTVENHLIRSSSNRLKFTGQRGQGKAAVTVFNLVTECKGFSLVLAMPKTGRTHQIRVHLAELGHPIIADSLYGGRAQSPMINRQALHAYKLTLPHPSTGELVVFRAPVPTDMAMAIKKICGSDWLELIENILK